MSRNKFIGLVLGLVAIGGIFSFTVLKIGDKVFGGGVTNPRIVTNSLIDFNPGINNTYNLGAYGSAWKNIYASGTTMSNVFSAAIGAVATPSINFLGDANTGLMQNNADNVGIVGGGVLKASFGSNGNGFYATVFPTVNNSYDLGAYGNAWRNIYASGTYRGYEALYTGNVTSTGIIYTGSVAQSDAGWPNTIYENAITATPAVGTGQGAQWSQGGEAFLGIYGQSTGVANLLGSKAVISYFDLRPDRNNAIHLGTSTTAWSNIYASGTAYASSTRLGFGIVGAPTYTFDGETNTGIYRPNASQIGFSIAGTQRFAVTASGLNVTGGVYSDQNNTRDLGLWGNAWKDVYASGTVFASSTAFQTKATSTMPCTAAIEGQLTYTQAGAGSRSYMSACLKDTDNNYYWFPMTNLH